MNGNKRKCAYCGKEYGVFLGNISIHSYKNICCSSECYSKLEEERQNEKIKFITKEDISVETISTEENNIDMDIKEEDISVKDISKDVKTNKTITTKKTKK